MKQLIIITIAIVALAGVAIAGSMTRDSSLQPIQGFAPDPAKDLKLTVAGKIVDMSGDVAWGVTNIPQGCKYQNLSTPTVVGFKKLLNTGTDSRVVFHRKHGVSFGNHSSAFTGFANCTSAVLERQ